MLSSAQCDMDDFLKTLALSGPAGQTDSAGSPEISGSERRRTQLRDAQRKHRQRRQEATEQLERRVAELQEQVRRAERDKANLYDLAVRALSQLESNKQERMVEPLKSTPKAMSALLSLPTEGSYQGEDSQGNFWEQLNSSHDTYNNVAGGSTVIEPTINGNPRSPGSPAPAAATYFPFPQGHSLLDLYAGHMTSHSSTSTTKTSSIPPWESQGGDLTSAVDFWFDSDEMEPFDNGPMYTLQ